MSNKCTCGCTAVGSNMHSSWCDYDKYPDSGLVSYDPSGELQPMYYNSYYQYSPVTSVNTKRYTISSYHSSFLVVIKTLTRTTGDLCEDDVNDFKTNLPFVSQIVNGKETIDFAFGLFKCEEV